MYYLCIYIAIRLVFDLNRCMCVIVQVEVRPMASFKYITCICAMFTDVQGRW